jgi:hypothetical protein
MDDLVSVRLIRITLLEGDPEGLRSASLAGRTTILIGCPWSRLKMLLGRPEANRPAVYFMVGVPLPPDEIEESSIEMKTESDEVAYIGECDSLVNRFAQHSQARAADWGQIFLATTTETTFNKAHARLAEHLLCNRARSAGRAELYTKTTSPGNIGADLGDMAYTHEFVENVATLAQALGILLFRPLLRVNRQIVPSNAFAMETDFESNSTRKSTGSETPARKADYESETMDSEIDLRYQPIKLPMFLFRYNGNSTPARMITDGKDFVILKGSKARATDFPSLPAGVKRMREAARLSKSLVRDELDNSLEIFQADFPTTSASAAGSMVYGASCAGPRAWFHEGTNLSYDEWAKGTNNRGPTSTPQDSGLNEGT